MVWSFVNFDQTIKIPYLYRYCLAIFDNFLIIRLIMRKYFSYIEFFCTRQRVRFECWQVVIIQNIGRMLHHVIYVPYVTQKSGDAVQVQFRETTCI